MDDLDRMFRRLVQNIRNGYPEYLSRPFEVAELYQNLIPYRHNRRELEIETNQDYEAALCQLLAGERGYLSGDEDMQGAIRHELASPNPNTAVFREFAASRVALSAQAVRKFNEMPASPTHSPSLVTPPTPTRATEPLGLGHAHAPPRQPASPPPPPPPISAPPTSKKPEPASSPATSARATPTTVCAYCGGRLPAGRDAAFCPHCGQNLHVQHCPACGTELDVGWHYCITCGRGVAAT
jgi:hypothetical protein